MEWLNLWLAALAVLMPFIVGFVVRSDWKPPVRAIVGTAVTVAATVVTYGFTEGWDFDEGLVVAVGAIYAATNAQMQLLWKDTGVYEWWKSLTTPGAPTAPLFRN